MDGPIHRKEVIERPCRRVPSRASSTGTANTQTTAKSASSSSSHPRTAASSNVPHAHRYHHSQCGDRAVAPARSSSTLSRESSDELKRTGNPISTLLHEKLQRERQAESDRQASRPWSSDLSSSTGDVQDPISPSKVQPVVVDRRPRSSHDDSASNKCGMGAKQTEMAVSTLHKQNFDLKLELFHRREKQSALEARIEKLESEQHGLEAVRDHLSSELEKRDKAIEEAVNMIVKLEARVDALVRERDIVRQIDAEEAYRPSSRVASESVPQAQRPNLDDDASAWLDAKTLARMPSFLSERSAHTENLRNVVLQSRGSLSHVRKISEVSSSSAEVSEVNRVGSPSLSMLSESSFVSIYGSKDGQDPVHLQLQEGMSNTDGTFDDRSPTPTRKTTPYMHLNIPSVAPGPFHGDSVKPGAITIDQMRTFDRTLNVESPLQKIERLGDQTRVAEGNSRPSTSGGSRAVVTPTPSQSARSPYQMKSSQDKKDSLQRVVTTTHPTQKELDNSHALPPTPDTVSSAILRKQKKLSGSQESLPTPTNAQPVSRSDSSERMGVWRTQDRHRPAMNAHMISTTAFTSRHGLATPELNADVFAGISQLTRMIPTRPRSAAETTISRPRSDSFVSDSDSDSDSDGGADAHPVAEKGDYWMRESYKPNKRKGGASVGRRPASPDLFSFPVDAGGWEPDAMFGALKGYGFLGSPVPGLKRDPVDEMASSLRSPPPEPIDPANVKPGPPVRRSSLLTHEAENALPAGQPSKSSPAKDRTSARRMNVKGRSNSVDFTRREPPPSRPQVDAASAGKRNHYPPISGLQSRGRGLGLNMLFRRSGSESHNTAPQSATEPTFPPPSPGPSQYQTPQFQQMQLRSRLGPAAGRSSVPPPATTPWMSGSRPPRNLEEDYQQSATPPPILRNRPPSAAPQMSSLITDHAVAPGPSVSESVHESASAAPASSGPGTPSKRKWLGLGRMGSLKNRV